MIWTMHARRRDRLSSRLWPLPAATLGLFIFALMSHSCKSGKQEEEAGEQAAKVETETTEAAEAKKMSEEQNGEEELAAKLEAELQAMFPPSGVEKLSEINKFMEENQSKLKTVSEWDQYTEQIKQCTDVCGKISESAAGKKSKEIPPLVMKGLESALLLFEDTMEKADKNLNKSRAYMKAANFGGAGKAVNKAKVYQAVTGIALNFHGLFTDTVKLTAFYGPREVRMSSFESLVEFHDKIKDEELKKGWEAVMREVYDREKDPDNKSKMKQGLESLDIPLEATEEEPSKEAEQPAE